jgi:ABC-type dipeptide/oligopeptide/nickel transport system permease subunit
MKKEWVKLLRQSSWSARIGLSMVLITLIAAVFAPLIAPYSQEEIVGGVWEPVGGDYLLGTDQIGRDMLGHRCNPFGFFYWFDCWFSGGSFRRLGGSAF